MTVVDTSALIAVLLREAAASACSGILEADPDLLMSAATLGEALIVARRRGVGTEMAALIDGVAIEIVPLMPADAHRAAEAYARWGKGAHPAGLNFGDCFAYALAKERNCPLLFVGDDFTRTDIKPSITIGW